MIKRNDLSNIAAQFTTNLAYTALGMNSDKEFVPSVFYVQALFMRRRGNWQLGTRRQERGDHGSLSLWKGRR